MVLATSFDPRSTQKERHEVEGTLRQLCPEEVQAGWRHKAFFEKLEGALYLTSCGQGAVLACATRDLDDRVAWAALADLEQLVPKDAVASTADSLTGPLRKQLRAVMGKYEGHGDKLAEVQSKVDNVKGVMQDNVRKILDTHVMLDGLEEKTDAMSTQSSVFLKHAGDLKHQMRMRALKMKCCAGLVVASIVAYFVIPAVS